MVSSRQNIKTIVKAVWNWKEFACRGTEFWQWNKLWINPIPLQFSPVTHFTLSNIPPETSIGCIITLQWRCVIMLLSAPLGLNYLYSPHYLNDRLVKYMIISWEYSYKFKIINVNVYFVKWVSGTYNLSNPLLTSLLLVCNRGNTFIPFEKPSHSC